MTISALNYMMRFQFYYTIRTKEIRIRIDILFRDGENGIAFGIAANRKSPSDGKFCFDNNLLVEKRPKYNFAE